MTIRVRSVLSLVMCACALIGLAKCAPEKEEPTATEKLRLTLDPKVKSYLIEGERAYKAGVFRLALAYTDSAEQLAPDLADIHFLRGRVYTDLNQLEIAREAYKVALEKDPKYAGARMNMGINEFRRGNLQEALKHFRAEEEVAPSSNLYLETARAYARLGVGDSARMAFESAIKLDSTNATAFMWYGQLHEETGEFEKAIEYSKKGLRLKPDDLDYHYVLGSQLYRVGQVEEAATHLKLVAEKRPWHHGAQYNMGQVLMRQGKETDAQQFLSQADKAQQLQQQINEAQEKINRDPNTLQNWINLGELQRKAGVMDRAVDAFKVAASMDPYNLFLQSNLASLIMESGDYDEAIRRLRIIVSVDPTLPDVWVNLGVAYANAGKQTEARRAWETALKLRSDDQTAREYLAKLSTTPTASR